jgi:exopolysaccharide biosynthesis WecB/TagA/CpsF family protein
MTLLSLDERQQPAGLAPAGDMPPRDIAGIAVAGLSRQAALDRIGRAFAERQHLHLAFCNAHLVNLAAADPALRAVLAGFLILPDGLGVDIAARLLHGAAFPANLNGTDFTPALLAAQDKPLSVMLLGARPGVAERAAARLSGDYPRHRFAVLSHGFFTPQDEPALLRRLEQERPDLLLVALGNPHQERWIASRLDARHCTVAAGVGALFDFLAGEVARAPAALRRWRLEWLYRLWLEPGRLWRRYVLGNPAFLWRVLRLKLLGRHAG